MSLRLGEVLDLRELYKVLNLNHEDGCRRIVPLDRGAPDAEVGVFRRVSSNASAVRTSVEGRSTKELLSREAEFKVAFFEGHGIIRSWASNPFAAALLVSFDNRVRRRIGEGRVVVNEDTAHRRDGRRSAGAQARDPTFRAVNSVMLVARRQLVVVHWLVASASRVRVEDGIATEVVRSDAGTDRVNRNFLSVSHADPFVRRQTEGNRNVSPLCTRAVLDHRRIRLTSTLSCGLTRSRHPEQQSNGVSS